MKLSKNCGADTKWYITKRTLHNGMFPNGTLHNGTLQNSTLKTVQSYKTVQLQNGTQILWYVT